MGNFEQLVAVASIALDSTNFRSNKFSRAFHLFHENAVNKKIKTQSSFNFTWLATFIRNSYKLIDRAQLEIHESLDLRLN